MTDKIFVGQMYDFIIRNIRDEDIQHGQEFLKRFLEGPQEVWETIQQKIYDLKQLWSSTECPDEYLTYLKRIVGWTPDLNSITKNLTDDQLRRLISISAALWKSRTTEEAIVDILQVLAPGRSRIWNWFDLRWVLDVTIFTEEHQGRDAYLLAFPAGSQEYWSNVRLVDPGVSTRTLVKDILNLMRPSGERYEIVYLKFLDLFKITGDLSQWSLFVGEEATVADGMMALDEGSVIEQGLVVNITGSGTWSSYMVSTRMKGTVSQASQGYGIIFYFDAVTTGGYVVVVSVANNTISLVTWDIVDGITGVVGTFDFSTISQILLNDVWYGIRVSVVPISGGSEIKVYFDGEERINANDSTYSQGPAGVVRNKDIEADCSEFEIMGLPVDSDTVEINH